MTNEEELQIVNDMLWHLAFNISESRNVPESLAALNKLDRAFYQ